MLSPELIVSCLLCERLADNEAALMHGFERFSKYTGYARSFAYAGPYVDVADAAKRPALLAIDATHYRHGSNLAQFQKAHIERELNKALAGFTPPPSAGVTSRHFTPPQAPTPPGPSEPPLPPALRGPICSGNWGCGAFGGDLQLKALLQVLACSLAGRPALHYFTFGDAELAEALNALVGRLQRNKCSVGELVKLVCHAASPTLD